MRSPQVGRTVISVPLATQPTSRPSHCVLPVSTVSGYCPWSLRVAKVSSFCPHSALVNRLPLPSNDDPSVRVSSLVFLFSACSQTFRLGCVGCESACKCLYAYKWVVVFFAGCVVAGPVAINRPLSNSFPHRCRCRIHIVFPVAPLTALPRISLRLPRLSSASPGIPTHLAAFSHPSR